MKIYFLSNYSIEFIFDPLIKKLDWSDKKLEISYPGFNQYQQQIFNPGSNIYKQNPQIVFLSVDVNYFFQNKIFFGAGSSNVLEELKNQTEQLFNSFNLILNKLPDSVIFIDNFYLDPIFNFGTLEYNNIGLEHIVDELNLKLFTLSRNFKNIRIINVKSLISKFGQAGLFDYRLYYLAKFKFSKKGIDELTNLYASHLKSYFGKRKKCIALDLDNTLWGGIIGQDGIENIILSNDGQGKAFYDFQTALLNLYHQGIILTICSKNSENVVEEVFNKHPYMVLKKEHFAVKKINWNNKADNLSETAKELNIGLDSIVFLDDSKFERELVKQNLPQVEVPELPLDPTLYVKFLKELDYFNFHKLTEEDFLRNEMYHQNAERKKLEHSFSNIQDYLRSLEMKITIRQIDDFSFPRIIQLIQKTNQFNTTTKRYNDSDVRMMQNSQQWLIYSFNVSDKFGDYGIVGVLILNLLKEKSEVVIDSFIMSCRVIGREIEQAILYFVTRIAKKNNCDFVSGEIIPTIKNEPCREVYKNFGFELISDTNWRLEIRNKSFSQPDYFELTSL